MVFGFVFAARRSPEDRLLCGGPCSLFRHRSQLVLFTSFGFCAACFIAPYTLLLTLLFTLYESPFSVKSVGCRTFHIRTSSAASAARSRKRQRLVRHGDAKRVPCSPVLVYAPTVGQSVCPRSVCVAKTVLWGQRRYAAASAPRPSNCRCRDATRDHRR